MNKQAVFDKVATHLISQNAKSFDEAEETCAYRGANGTSCAIGCLIDDNNYTTNLEGCTVQYPIVTMALPLEYQGDDIINLLRKLQKIHDDYEVEYWPSQLIQLAADWGLNTPKILQGYV